jgi:aminoglycoside phosphotransferase family enzyme
VYDRNNTYRIGGNEGTITDYAIRMYKQDREKQMDVLLTQHKVTGPDIRNLAEKIAVFHKKTKIIYQKDFLDIREMFNDLGSEKNFSAGQPDSKSSDIINSAIKTSDNFIKNNKELLAARLGAGFFRDCHGDLHSRNIFLLHSPQPFDCIEFNDDLREIDVLNEAAFLCMDLDAFARQDLSELFIDCYNQFFPAMKTAADHRLFIYYKSYRANVRAKVNCLRAKSAKDDAEKMKALSAADKYLSLMDSYIRLLH